MEINLGQNFGGTMGVKLNPSGAEVENVQRATTEATQPSRASNLTIGEGVADLSSAEPTADIPDAALRRDDKLGNLISTAFSLPAPPMPAFVD